MVNRNKKKGTAFETECKRAFPGDAAIRISGPGNIDVLVRGDDKEALLSVECENSQRMLLKFGQRTKLAQARRLKRSGTLPALMARGVGKPGQPQEAAYVVMERDDFIALLGRLGVLEELP